MEFLEHIAGSRLVTTPALRDDAEVFYRSFEQDWSFGGWLAWCSQALIREPRRQLQEV